MKKKYNVYDLETLLNCFTAYFLDVETGREKAFVIHKSRNDLLKLIKFLKGIYRHGYWLVGYNCLFFDAQILEFIIANYKKWKLWDAEDIANAIYERAQFIIKLDQEEKRFHIIPEWNLQIPHLDLYKIKHYDGKQKRCSLKWLEFSMRFPNIESMPFHHSHYVEDNEVEDVLRYNANDVRATKRSFEINMYEIELRESLSEEYDINLLNASEPKMARDIFGKFLSEAMGITYRELKEMKTERYWLKANEIIFDYITFDDPILNGAKQFFEKLEFNPANIKLNNYDLEKVERVFKWNTIPDMVVGLGGIHGCVKPGIYTSNSNWVIHDIDATSYYPNLGIKNRLFPEHLQEEIFCATYEGVFDKRQTYDKKDKKNYALKIVLNSAYGLSKEAHCYLYDPKYTFSITINGQLLLLKLGELLKKNVKTVVFYQFNTDGVTIGYDPKESKKVEKVMKEWTKLTKIKLEDQFYEKMIIVDVNNYIAINTKGSVKRKGLFGYSMNPEDKEMDYHKNPSALVVPMALEQYFLKGTPVKDYILNHKDIYDFCLGVKIKKDFHLYEHYFDSSDNRIKKRKIEQTVCRYYVSKETTSLKKEYTKEYMAEREADGKKAKKDKSAELAAKWNTTLFNVYHDPSANGYNINFKYYIERCRKIIDQVEPHATQVKLFSA